METLPHTKSHRKLQADLQADPAAYTESVGKYNKQMTGDIASHTSGEGTVLRLFFGATQRMPLRGLSYIMAATRIARHIPHEQLQVIFVSRLGEAVNGIQYDDSQEQALNLREVSRRILETRDPEIESRTLFAEDTIVDLASELRDPIGELIRSDAHLLGKLASKGNKHGSDFATYGAAHVVHQETDVLTPIGLTPQEPAPVTPEQLVSIGCQQEHPFYALRVKARQLIDGVPYIPSSQIFTRHLVSPYYEAKGGEQFLDEALANGVDLGRAQDPSARRDVQHLLQIIPGEEIQI